MAHGEKSPSCAGTADQMSEQAVLSQLLKENEHAQRENQLLAAFLSKAAAAHDSPDIAAGEEQGRKRKASVQRKADVEALRPLTEEEKGDLVGQAIEALETEIEEVSAAGEKDLDDLRTLLEEVDMRIGETKRATYEFKRDVILGGEDAHTGIVSADKVVRLFEDRITSKDVLLEKVALKNNTFKAAIAKLEAQLAHKEEMGEVLHLVDFDQLKIENQQLMETIGVKSKELVQLKLATGKTVQMLTATKERLAQLENEGVMLRQALAARQQELAGFEEDFAKTVAHVQGVKSTLKLIKDTHANKDLPLTLDYIKLKQEVADLHRLSLEWRHKVQMATAAMQSKPQQLM